MIKQIFYRIFHIVLYTILLYGCSFNENTIVRNYKNTHISKDSVDHYIKDNMKELKVPGLSFSIINNGEVVYHNSYGYANLEKKLPVNSETIFEAASLSKSIFAFFVMKYVEEGKLDLDKPLYKYLPYSDIAYDERYKKITARMVLSHRSGFPNWRENEKDKKLKIKFEPGTRFEYSGEGYQYLAMVLKKIEGGDWKLLEKSFQNKVAKPLGMNSTVFIQNKTTRKLKAEPYDKDGHWIDWENNYWYKKDDGIFVAPSSLHTNSLDFSKWMIAIMKNEHLSESSYKELLGYESKAFTSDSGTAYYYTLGFMTGDKEFKNVYFHSGSNDGFTCWYVFDKANKWGYVLFTNSEKGVELGEKMFGYLGGMTVWK
ncbi:beta-lactamase family protein [Sinomicrobium sp. 2019215]|nr:serine hydrolase domain-containing protein [Sinomicrobium weinanense]MBU3123790.1 beta-lactamase family protein [Sinomicrobium weinanense]